MRPADAPATATAAEMRRAFDAAFAEPAVPPAAAGTDFLRLTAAGRPYAVPRGDVAAVRIDRPLLGIPSRRAELAGLLPLRGAFAPVFRLASLLGAGDSPRAPRTILLCAGEEPMGLLLDRVDGFVQVRGGEAPGPSAEPAGHRFLRGSIRVGDETLPVISIPAIVRFLRGDRTGG